MDRQRKWIRGSTTPITAALLVSMLWLGACHRMGPPHHWRADGPINVEEAREHAEDAARWMLRKVDASPDQQDKAQQIVSRAVEGLVPLADQHRNNRKALLEELGKPTIDRDSLEQLRLAELHLADRASQQLLSMVVDLGEVLTPEQRSELLTMAQRQHRRHHRHMH